VICRADSNSARETVFNARKHEEVATDEKSSVAVAVLSLAQCLPIGAAAAGKVAPAVSSDRLWTAAAAPTASARNVEAGATPRSPSFRLNEPRQNRLWPRADGADGRSPRRKRTMTVPTPEGEFLSLRIEQAPILGPRTPAAFSGTRTYGRGAFRTRRSRARLDFTRAGFHAQVITDKGTFYVDPTRPAASGYTAVLKSDLPARSFTCGVETPLAEGCSTWHSRRRSPRARIFAPTACGHGHRRVRELPRGRTAAENQSRPR